MSALLRAQAPKVRISDIELGRKGFLGYLRALGGSNIVKVTPNGGASEAQATEKGLRVVCGSNTGYLEDGAWITEKMAMSDTCEVRVSPNVSVIPNLGGIELAEALSRVIPFAADKKDARPVLQCIRFAQKEGKLTLTSADGYRLATVSLDFVDGEGEALIPADELKGLVSALKKAKRVKLAFEPNGIVAHSNLVIDTEAIRYRWSSENGTYPDYEQVIPTEFRAEARVDTREMLRAAASLTSLAATKEAAILISIKEGKVRLSAKEESGEALIEAEAEGEAQAAISGAYLIQALKAIGGIVELRVNEAKSPILFQVDGYRLLVMPIFLPSKADTKAEAEGEVERESEAEGEGEPVAVADNKPKGRRKAKEPVAVEA